MRAVAYCTNLEKIEMLKNELEAGNIYINAKPGRVDISVAMGGIKDSAFPAGAKYYPQDLTFQKYVYDSTSANIDKLK